jgi:hypothetical protein
MRRVDIKGKNTDDVNTVASSSSVSLLARCRSLHSTFPKDSWV